MGKNKSTKNDGVDSSRGAEQNLKTAKKMPLGFYRYGVDNR